MPLVEVSGGSGSLALGHARAAIELGSDRRTRDEVAFGFRQLVDIAGRALSPAVNDPSTATQCLDAIHDLLRVLVERPYPSAVRVDDEGVPRAILRLQRWEDHVGLALDEIRHWGEDAPQVRVRLQALVDDLLLTEGDQDHGGCDGDE